jgi:hypothetical protein
VRWNHFAASQAIRALENAANLVDDSWSDRRRAATVATATWRGRHREAFDNYLKDTERGSRLLAAELRDKANEIRRQDAAAYEEQRRRERERRRWFAEKLEEDRRRAIG